MSQKIIDYTALQNYIQQYKISFNEHRITIHNEIYKWIAVKHFQDHWNIDAVDFGSMIQTALYQTGNLLASKQYYPRGTIEMFAKSHPEIVREMFRNLYNEEKDLVTRCIEFENESIQLLRYYPEYKMTYQNPNSISTYLWLKYPDKYYVFKYSVMKDIAQKIFGSSLPAGKWERMTYGFEMQNVMSSEIKKDSELLEMSRNSLDEKCYPDHHYNILTTDIGYFISKNNLNVTQEPSTNNCAHKLNMILYGPPGTGKTYSTILYAVAIIEEANIEKIKSEDFSNVYQRYLRYKNNGLIEFITFHQSYGYEEFVEGIRPIIQTEDSDLMEGNIEYTINTGIFKGYCERASIPQYTGRGADLGINQNPTIWKVSLESSGHNPTRLECMKNNHIRIGWVEYGESLTENMEYNFGGKNVLNSFYSKMQIGDLVFSCFSERTIDAIGVITSGPRWENEFDSYKRVRDVKWLVKGLDEDIVKLNNDKVMTLSSIYKLSVSVSDCMSLLKRVKPDLFEKNVKFPNHVFIIDEINRGNVSKIFGELITLIEPTKRLGEREALVVNLPYSGTQFGVPNNVYILGTMNTADRSIALIDTALRRRFDFMEMLPDSSLLKDVFVEGIEISELMDTLNMRIHVLLDREHTIGHSYFLSLKEDPTLTNLAYIFEYNIVPLLQEYFYDDYEKIQLVLGDNQKNDEGIRFVTKFLDNKKLFGKTDVDFQTTFRLNSSAFHRIESYAFIK